MSMSCVGGERLWSQISIVACCDSCHNGNCLFVLLSDFVLLNWT